MGLFEKLESRKYIRPLPNKIPRRNRNSCLFAMSSGGSSSLAAAAAARREEAAVKQAKKKKKENSKTSDFRERLSQVTTAARDWIGRRRQQQRRRKQRSSFDQYKMVEQNVEEENVRRIERRRDGFNPFKGLNVAALLSRGNKGKEERRKTKRNKDQVVLGFNEESEPFLEDASGEGAMNLKQQQLGRRKKRKKRKKKKRKRRKIEVVPKKSINNDGMEKPSKSGGRSRKVDRACSGISPKLTGRQDQSESRRASSSSLVFPGINGARRFAERFVSHLRRMRFGKCRAQKWPEQKRRKGSKEEEEEATPGRNLHLGLVWIVRVEVAVNPQVTKYPFACNRWWPVQGGAEVLWLLCEQEERERE